MVIFMDYPLLKYSSTNLEIIDSHISIFQLKTVWWLWLKPYFNDTKPFTWNSGSDRCYITYRPLFCSLYFIKLFTKLSLMGKRVLCLFLLPSICLMRPQSRLLKRVYLYPYTLLYVIFYFISILLCPSLFMLVILILLWSTL